MIRMKAVSPPARRDWRRGRSLRSARCAGRRRSALRRRRRFDPRWRCRRRASARRLGRGRQDRPAGRPRYRGRRRSRSRRARSAAPLSAPAGRDRAALGEAIGDGALAGLEGHDRAAPGGLDRIAAPELGRAPISSPPAALDRNTSIEQPPEPHQPGAPLLQASRRSSRMKSSRPSPSRSRRRIAFSGGASLPPASAQDFARSAMAAAIGRRPLGGEGRRRQRGEEPDHDRPPDAHGSLKPAAGRAGYAARAAASARPRRAPRGGDPRPSGSSGTASPRAG